jgi:transposase
MIGFESTAHYHQTLFNYLTENHYKCYLINPLMISRFRSISLRDSKNDNIDSRAISGFLLLEHEHLIDEDFSINELKELCLQRSFLISSQTTLKIKLTSYLDRVFPELCSVIPDGTLYSKGVFGILKQYPTARQISETRIDRLVNLAKSASKGRYKESMVIKIKEAARSSIGLDSQAFSLKIRQSIEAIEIHKRQIDEINEAIINHHIVINSPLHQIKGINSIEIGYIMSAIISIDRFDSPTKLIAYAGLDPKVRQSGTWKAAKTRMSKRGNVLLRYALIWTANNIRKHPSRMKEYYLKKKSQHKSHYNALGHCAAKLCHYIFWILNNPEKQFIN